MKKLRLTLDVLMYSLLLYLASYRPGAGLFNHGLIGTLLLALFIVHLFLNRRFFTGLFKGRYTRLRIFTVSLDAALILTFGGLLLSSVLLSGDVYSFSPFRQTFTMRLVHAGCTAWALVLINLHAGLHLSALLRRMDKRLTAPAGRLCWQGFLVLIALLGLWSFAGSSWPAKLCFELTRPGPAPHPAFFAGSMLLFTAACAVLMQLVQQLLRRWR